MMHSSARRLGGALGHDKEKGERGQARRNQPKTQDMYIRETIDLRLGRWALRYQQHQALVKATDERRAISGYV